jgi:predicted anti-sigma-YlaC factor YlaD
MAPVKRAGFYILVFMLLTTAGCIKTLALKKVAAALTADGGTVFTGDDDPQLIADALPFALKTYESLLQSLPDDENLLLATGKAFCMYSYAFIHSPADTIADIRIDDKTAQLLRAKRMYLRARGYILRAFDLRHPGFTALLDSNLTDSALGMTTIADTTLLYWAGASWMGAFTTDKFDMSLALDMPKAVACMQRLLSLHESYGAGSVHDFFISYYGSMPASMGGSEKKAREHFARSLELSGGAAAGPYVSLASSVSVGNQNAAEFQSLLEHALAIPVDRYPHIRLANILSCSRAGWLLKHKDNYFLGGDGFNGREFSGDTLGVTGAGEETEK